MIHARRVLHKAQRKGERCGGDRQVDQEHRAPAHDIDQPPAQQRADGARTRAGRGPDADGAATRVA